MQETTCRIDQLLATGKLPFRDEGSSAFYGWIWQVILNETRRAWLHCRPLWFKRCISGDLGNYAEPVVDIEPSIAWDDLLVLISRIGDLEIREVLIDWYQGLTLAESGALHGWTVAKVRVLRERGKAEIWLLLSEQR